MQTTDQVEIRFGLPEYCRRQAAELYYEAFRQKFEPIMSSRQHGVAILEKAFDPELAIVALCRDRLAGVAGLQYGGRQFANVKASAFAREFGWLSGLLRCTLFAFFVQHQRKGELLIESIAVDSSMRGKGIGTRLLQAVFGFAQANGFGSVRLDVVDTNPGARRLYERLGFVPTQTRKYPFLHRVMGFSADTTMIKEVV